MPLWALPPPAAAMSSETATPSQLLSFRIWSADICQAPTVARDTAQDSVVKGIEAGFTWPFCSSKSV